MRNRNISRINRIPPQAMNFAQIQQPGGGFSLLAIQEETQIPFHSQLHPLTQNKAQMLGIPQFFKPTQNPFETRASTRQIYAGQRVYRLWPIFDPTAVIEKNPNGQSVAPGEKEAALRSQTSMEETGSTAPIPEKDAVLRNQIPPKYLNPLQFKYSREEVLYDMKAALGTLPPESGALARWFFIYPLRLLKSLITSFSSRRGIKKWRTMLKGKNPDDQLWAVTPPRGFSYHFAVRRWAEETLIRAGYDLERVFLEWEIFWRRKGWN